MGRKEHMPRGYQLSSSSHEKGSSMRRLLGKTLGFRGITRRLRKQGLALHVFRALAKAAANAPPIDCVVW
jgi:hypothetical protein